MTSPTASMALARWLRGLGAALALLALVVAVPWALLRWGDWPITGVPSWDQVRDLPGTVASDSAIIGAFTVALWVAWAAFVACLVAEVAAEARGREATRVAAFGPLQRLARHLVATVAMTVGWLGPLAGPLHSPPVRPAGAATGPAMALASAGSMAPGSAAEKPASDSGATSGQAAASGGAGVTSASGVSGALAAAPGATVTVRPGDSPWALAVEHLGDGARWTEIWDLNRSLPQPDGRSWEIPEIILPGWELTLPAAPATGPLVVGPGQIIVQPDDNPWSLAESHLGDGKRWRELYDANRGHIQADGSAWVTESLIEPGWILDLPTATSAPAAPAPPVPIPPAPAPASDIPAPEASEPAPGSPPASSDSADGSSGTADGSAGSVPDPSSDTADDSAGSAPESSSGSDNGSSGSAGSDSASPGSDAAGPAPGATAPASGREPQDTAPEGDTGAEDEAVDDGGASDLDIAPVVVAGMPAVLAAGVVMRLDRVRRRRSRRRPRDERQPPLPDGLQEIELRWRAIADNESAEWVDTALRYLTWAVRSTGAPVSVVAVRTGAHGLELLLSTPARQGAPRFAADATGWQWQLRCDDLSEIRGIAADEPPYAPGLVTLGTTDDGSTVLIDAEQLGLTSVEGDAGVVGAWLTGVALDVATAPWATDVDLRLVGGLVELGALEQVSLLEPPDVASVVEATVAATARSLGRHPSTQAARGAAGREPWPPLTVVVSAPGTDQPVVDVTVPARGAAVVAAGPVPRATVRLVAGADGYATLYPYGLSVRLSAVDPRTAGDTARLLTGAAAPIAPPTATGAAAPWPVRNDVTPHEERDDAGADEATDEARERYAALIRSILEPGEIEVVVLGKPQVTGWEHEPRQRSIEIVCYLAVHDGAVTGEKLRDCIFPPGFKATSLRQAVSRTRTALGRSASGYPHILPAFAVGSYELGPAVRSDFRRFRALVAAARKAPAECEIQLLRTALGLVRAQPFSETPAGGYGWASAEGISYAVERIVTDTAQRLGELALAAGDPGLAEWAARQGQRAVPGHEGLYRDLALAKLRQGDVDGFSAVRREAEAAATTFDPLDGLQPETQEFFTRALAQYNDLRQAANDY
jgi:nucleoid-associated protein YgaU